MKKALRYTLLTFTVIVVIVGVAAAYIKFGLPDTGDPENITIHYTPERVQRGEYLANHVTLCVDCHSTRDWSLFSAPPTAGTLGKGGEAFTPQMGFPGSFYSANITPAAVSGYTDGELFRAITTGVKKNGKAMFPVMPYLNYGKMDREDIYDIIAYIRTLQPLDNKIPESEADFPVNFLINTMPTKAALVTKPPVSDTIAYGGYLVKAGACGECHTPFDRGKFDEAFRLAGGRIFELPGGTLRSANITPAASGIGKLSKSDFITLFKQYADSNYRSPKIDFTKEYNTIMPWTMYAGMKEEDLGAIYVYLRTLQPVDHEVVKFTGRK
ncbi:c-type cytochrome [Sediminibacterium soli]|uniref:c-type cytochrome n=1 Tax=Sediminibacterium soli TaxID=2698829 RepID=UPI00137AE86A|nr:cytochrome c [Sediminibacterium soli]NCI46152.1 cytochrome c [Sediminibacterium soli]